MRKTSWRFLTTWNISTNYRDIVGTWSLLQSRRNHTETSGATETSSERERRLEDLRQNAKSARATESSLQHEVGDKASKSYRNITSHRNAVKIQKTSGRPSTICHNRTSYRDIVGTWSRLQSQWNRIEESRATETSSEREGCLKGLRQHATSARATETPLEDEGGLQSERNCTITSGGNETEVQHESRVESHQIQTSSRRAAERREQYVLRREQNPNRMVVNPHNFVFNFDGGSEAHQILASCL